MMTGRIASWVTMGVVLGTVIGVVLGNIGLGIAIGIVAGLALAGSHDPRTKHREGGRHVRHRP
jgi:mannose/fructose/N-acetylgalactosamine-specific phosphotransferase system component IIC